MEACRICNHYLNTNDMLSIHKFSSQGLSYSDMIKGVFNLKILIDDELANMICFTCEQKLGECYEFKTVVERAEKYHRERLNKKLLIFNSIEDVIDTHALKQDSDIDTKPTLIWNFFYDGTDEIPYNNITIKKVEPAEVNKEDIMIFEDNDDHNFEDDFDVNNENDEQEMSLQSRIRKSKRKEKKKNVDDSDEDHEIGMDVLRSQNSVLRNKLKKKEKKYTARIKHQTKVKIKPTVLKCYKVVPPPIAPRKKQEQRTKKTKATICPICGLLKKNLKSHLLIHAGEKKYKCDICPDKAFHTNSGLQSHKAQHHSMVYYQCDHCVARLKTKFALRSHMKSHMDIRAYACEICNKRFKRKSALQRHVRIHNIANKSIKCQLCNMSFFYNGGLKHHMRIHTGERPYKCEICNQPYSYKHDFNRHCFNKHGIFLKRRDVRIMNEEVLIKEKQLTQDLIQKINNFNNSDGTINPFSGPQAALAFEMAVEQLIKDNAMLCNDAY